MVEPSNFNLAIGHVSLLLPEQGRVMAIRNGTAINIGCAIRLESGYVIV